MLRDRQQRIALTAALSTAASLVLAIRMPLVLLTLAPLALGVPHLVSDLRYLVVRQGLHQRRTTCLAVSCCLLGCVFAPGLGWGIGAVAVAVLAARSAFGLRLLAAMGCAAAWFAARAVGPRADALFAHAHNLVALGFWIAWARGNRREVLPGLGVFIAGVALLFSGAFEPLLVRTHALVPGRYALDAFEFAATLSPVRDPIWALRWAIVFAFAQAVHYGVWLRSVPEEDRARPGLRSFSSSYRALVADLGPGLIWVALALTVGFAAAAGFDVASARAGYLRLALFHGPLELAVAALLLLERRPLLRAA
jgi:hypothetical protein